MKTTVYDRIASSFISFIKWFGGFFEDQKGAGSSKRIALYVALGMLWYQVKSAADGKITDATYQSYQMSLWVVGCVVLFLVGAITREFFAKVGVLSDIPVIDDNESKQVEKE